jgi:hypothetical protein
VSAKAKERGLSSAQPQTNGGLENTPSVMRATELGVFPAEWRVDRFDSLFDVQQGRQVSKGNRIGENQRPFLRTKNVFWNRLDLADLDEMHFSEADESRLALKPDDLLICEGGDIGRGFAIRRLRMRSSFFSGCGMRLNSAISTLGVET